jgi:hypothetical protein
MSDTRVSACIDACLRCAQACEHCADACLDEAHMAMLSECIRRDRDCAALCWLAAGFMSRDSRLMGDICRLCADACDACAAECRRHEMNHCRECAEACASCAAECRKMVH